MQFKNLAKLSLQNRLRSFALPQLELTAAPFGYDKDYVTLEFSALSASFVLQLADKELPRSLPELAKRKEQLSALQLPYELACAFFELFLQDECAKLTKLLESTVSVIGYGENFVPEKYQEALSFIYRKNGLSLPLTLYIKNGDALLNLLQKLDIIAKNLPKSVNFSNTLKLPLRLALGNGSFSLSELTSLQPGDAIVIDNFYLPQNEISLLYQNYAARGKISEGKISLLTSFMLKSQQDPIVKINSGSVMPNNNVNKQVAQESLSGIDKVKLEVDFVLDSRLISFSELRDLTVGSTVELLHHDLNNVRLEVNGQAIAYGRVIDLGDRFALQITAVGQE